MLTAKVFWSGRSQAIRLPKEFRFDTDEVAIRRHGASIVLEPLEDDWKWLDTIDGPFDDDVVLATEEDIPVPDRPAIEFPE